MKRKPNVKAMIIIMILGVAVVNSLAIFFLHNSGLNYEEKDPIFHSIPMHEFLLIISSTVIIFVSMVALLYFMRNVMIDALESLDIKK